MDARKIKDILISYLTAVNDEIRIYQEKSIGSSICDIMAVTDKLIGFEIKSDLDNYARLQEQIKAYNSFFDKNYLVVGARHLASAAGRIPDDWGIICIQDDAVSVTRKAGANRSVSRRKQLSILWQLELKNILLKNGMPVYAQKGKGYIADRIAARVEEKALGEQIAQELMRRDYALYDAKDYTIYSNSNSGDEFPAEEIVDMLSEKDLADFTLDKWIALYKQATAVREQKAAVYKRPVENRAPHAIPYTDIEVSLGVPWIGEEIINEFVIHLLGDKRYRTASGGQYTPRLAEYEPVTGSWFIRDKQSSYYNNANTEVKFGLKRYNALYILEATLNLREIKLYDYGTVYNERDTLAAIEKQKLIQEEFKAWIWEDEDRRWLVEDAYNKLFSKYEKPAFDGSRLTFPDMSPAYQLYPYQKDAVQRILDTKNTLLAFDVGAGKTYIMIAAAMKMRMEGISRKNMFVVPNHIVGQWEKIFSQLYPKAKILAIEPKTFKPEMRHKQLRQIRDGDYDGIIIAYSCFEMIPLSVDAVLRNMDLQLSRIDAALKDMRSRHRYGWTETALGNEKKYFEKLTDDFIRSMNESGTDGITFDELEINTLFVDEAHNYKNLPIRTKLKNLNGINTKGSMKCQDLLHKVRQVQQTNGGRGAVFATGTPLCNSIADAYAMQVYLQYDELEKSQLDKFDNWVKTFAQPEQLCEIDVDTSHYRFVRRFAKFFNLPELSAMFSQIAIFYANDSAADLPEVDGYRDVVIPQYYELIRYMNRLCERTEAIRSGMIDRKYDNMLKVSTDGRKAALSLKLVGAEQPYSESSKVYRCVKNVAALYKKHPGTTQVVFCDYSTPKGADYSVYSELKERLTEAGIPEKEIAFIHSYQTEARKVELFRQFNAGKMRILIGSTFKLGIGANIQVKLKAIHHLDVPWRPADMVQREGRILRRGNENENVLIYRYITQGSFDSYSWQILETKQRFISQFLTGSAYQRTASDLENNVLTYAEVKALALSEPLMKELAEKENEARTLRIIVAKDNEARENAAKELKELEEELPKLKLRCGIANDHFDQLSGVTADEFLAETRRISKLFTEKVVTGREPLRENVRVLGFDVCLPQTPDAEKPYVNLEKDGNTYRVTLGLSTEGNAKRIIYALKKFEKTAKKIKDAAENAVRRKEELEKLLGTRDHTHQNRLAACEAEIARIQAQLKPDAYGAESSNEIA